MSPCVTDMRVLARRRLAPVTRVTRAGAAAGGEAAAGGGACAPGGGAGGGVGAAAADDDGDRDALLRQV